MIGIPSVFNTKQDYYNAVDYACSKNEGKPYVAKALHDLKDNVYMLVLKKSSKDKPAEEQTPEDFEKVENPACTKYQLGFTDDEINALLSKVE